MYARDGGVCIACHTPTHYDRCPPHGCHHCYQCAHIVALANGGTDEVDNLACLCRGCNRACGKADLRTYLAARARASSATTTDVSDQRNLPMVAGAAMQRKG